ncbi:LuxR C-terminal-related transcriptional regulator [Marivita sp.]|uniref:helix-turn-helix transcriptional regulator n=1 Tax=Marivita sp. TaxID=2003365 RepID=UPI0025B9AB50|nr:LuxR C-terminal-related transcriptional regulator [Marivita sp.]
MTLQRVFFGKSERRAALLAVIILAQALCAMFFVGDVIADYLEAGRILEIHLLVETMAAAALVAGVVILMRELRQIISRMRDIETGLRAARGDMVTVIEAFFDSWNLSAAERDVALLLLKGFDNESIATLRGTAKGTVRAQASSIYAKAGVDGRAQLISIFLEELLADDGDIPKPAVS